MTRVLGIVLLDISVSLDGFVATSDDDVERLHRWALIDAFTENMRFSDDLLEVIEDADAGAVISGRRTFDLASGWAGKPTMDVPYVILSHKPAPEEVTSGEWASFVFVSAGIEAAVAEARKLAEGRTVYVMGGADIAQQCIKAGLLDELQLHVVPVLLGSGVRLFDHLDRTELEHVSTVVCTETVRTRYRVLK